MPYPATRTTARGALHTVPRGARALAADRATDTLLVGTALASGANALHALSHARAAPGLAPAAVYDTPAEIWAAAPLPATPAGGLAALALRTHAASLLALWRLPAAPPAADPLDLSPDRPPPPPPHRTPRTLSSLPVAGRAHGLATLAPDSLAVATTAAVHVVAVDASAASLAVTATLPGPGGAPVVAAAAAPGLCGGGGVALLVATRDGAALVDVRAPASQGGGAPLALRAARGRGALRLAPARVRVRSAAAGEGCVVAVGCEDGGVVAVDVRGGGGGGVVWRAPAHAHWVTCVAVGDGGAVASGSTDGVARAWADGVNVGTYPIHGETVYGTAWVGAAGFASCSFDGRVALNAPTGGGAAARGRH